MAPMLVRRALDVPTAAGLLEAVDAHPAWSRRSGDGFDPYSSSLKLAALAGIDVGALASHLLEGAAGESCRAGLGDALAVDIDRCWVRRQYAPGNAPDRHAPHAWHQDGALGFDFSSHAPGHGDGTLLAMRTCWIALTACGTEAPGLALLKNPFTTLLGLERLDDSAVRRSHADGAFWTPVMEPGDALVFDGGALHRTHVAPSMHADRTSVELRFFDAARIPPRLRADTFIHVH